MDVRQGKFDYTIRIEIQFTGQELHLLTDAARAHYDGACRNYFVRQRLYPCQGAVWREDFTEQHGAPPEAKHNEVVRVVLSSSEIDRCKKILGGARGLGWSAKLIFELDRSLAHAFQAIQAESERLTPEPESEQVV